ncbi:MAG: hypothetical protein JWO67_3389 [Streptosporangiaceae bacterium]|jgi:hypothetical protein|nr:hypothetical protein [Streptosporangiaceae bacterium]
MSDQPEGTKGSGDLHSPGEIVPESGFYECDGDDEHRWSTDVSGHRFPPMPQACRGSGWRLGHGRPEPGTPPP